MADEGMRAAPSSRSYTGMDPLPDLTRARRMRATRAWTSLK